MNEHLDIFDILLPQMFCNDDDINLIYEMIKNETKQLVDNGKFKDCNYKYDYWIHAKELRKRLGMMYWFCEEITDDYFKNREQPKYIEIYNSMNYDKIFDFCEDKKIELTISATPYCLMFSTRFLDKRQKL